MSGNQLFDCLKDTLILLSANKKAINNLAKAEGIDVKIILEDHLQEIEGDYHTFLHIDNLNQLKEQKLIDGEVVLLATQLRNYIGNIPIDLWNAGSFEKNDEWKAIHLLAQKIVNLI
jgi:hypothetical protein